MTSTTTLESRGDERAPGPSDAELLDRVRTGERDAYGQLYLRHEPAAKSLARYMTKSNHDADDVVADAFARVLRAIKGGAGPTEAFRPYLLTAVRRTVWRRSDEASHIRLAASDDEEDLLDARLAVEPEDRTEEALILRAFKELPERWQLVLWHTEIEGQPPATVAPLLGLSPNATAALAVRAREGLRQAYLQAHLQSRPADTCRFSIEHLGAFVRDGLGQRDSAKVEEHLDACADCTGLRAELGSLNKVLRSVVGPAVLGTGAARYLAERAGSAGSGEVDHARAVGHRLRFPQAVGVAAVAAVAMVALGIQSDVAGSAQPTRTEPVSLLLPDPSPAGPQVVDAALVGTPATVAPGIVATPCRGANLPLSLPDGATPTGASLVEAPGADQPQVVEPGAASRLEPVPGGDAPLVGAEGACVSNLITPLDDAPPDTALAVSFLDRLGRLNVLLVPQIVTVVQDALQAVTDGVAAANDQAQDYLETLADAAGQLPGSGDVPDGSAPSGGPPPVPDTPPADVPDLPALPPPGDAVDEIGDLVDGTLDGVNDTLDGLVG